MKNKFKLLIVLSIVILLLIGLAVFYANDYYHAVDVDNYMTSDKVVIVNQIDEGYFFDGPGTDKALIFYPGAKVEETAYSPLLRSLAEEGIDCFLIKMPMKMAFLGMNKADDIREEYSYEHYYLAGHSLGGAMIANYSADHPSDYDGLFLLAAYPSKDLSKTQFPILFIYGDKDNILNRDALKKGFSLVPPDYSEEIIKGGNHSGFASYSEQKGDGVATILKEKQWDICKKSIINIIEN